VATVNSAAFCDLSPHQIVPRLADAGQYLASESTISRVLRAEQQLAHRGRTAVPQRRTAPSHEATGPNPVWSWDITYLKRPVRGVFWYPYLILDIWSRKIVGWTVEATERSAHAAARFRATCAATTHAPNGIVVHADTGGPMKGATMLATLERLGVLAWFSRPGVSTDNPSSAALFRTARYRPDSPREPFTDLALASA
jgi:transposase InsO family protein